MRQRPGKDSEWGFFDSLATLVFVMGLAFLFIALIASGAKS